MVIYNCPANGCLYTTDAIEAAAAVQQLTIHGYEHAPAAAAPVALAPPPPAPAKMKLDAPKINTGTSAGDWESFKKLWTMYRNGMQIPADQRSTHLFHSCERELQDDLMRSNPNTDLATITEADLLTAIEDLAVKKVSILVQRIKMANLKQTPGVGVKNFGAELRGQSKLCKYTVKCTADGCNTDIDYSDDMIKDHLVRGIADPEILADLLGDPKPDRTLAEVVDFIAIKEQAKTERGAMGESVNSASSSKSPANTNNKAKNCWACGELAHGIPNNAKVREEHCKAWTVNCPKCDGKGHLPKQCSKCTHCGQFGHRNKGHRSCAHHPKKTEGKQENSCMSDNVSYLCAASFNRSNKIEVNHHIFNKVHGWVESPSKPHPSIMATAKAAIKDHTVMFKTPLKNPENLKSLYMPMMADSCCQSTIAPAKTIYSMGFKKPDMIKVRMKMSGAGDDDLGIIGAVVLDIESKDRNDQTVTTKQLCYVSTRISKIFLSRQALEDLRIIQDNFPLPMSGNNSLLGIEDDSPCSCPERASSPPTLPETLPEGFKGTEEEVPKLKDWILQHYGSTCFNICDHQKLPKMTGAPLRLHMDKDATPSAIHKPTMVPIHWRDQVKFDLDRDIRLGILEKVPENTPTTWLSRMVVTSKADGSPRRTVDMQPQNKSSVRQTYPTEAPFKLASRIPEGKKKTIIDSWNGFHSVPIADEDRHVTTFLTPWGRYRYCVAPMGFLSSGDAFNERYDAITVNHTAKVRCVDDTCTWADTVSESFFQTCELLDTCAKNGITLNPKKFQFCQDTVTFAGLEVTLTNIRPCQKFLDAILNYPTPTDISGARGWYGLVNQAAYAFFISKEMDREVRRHHCQPHCQSQVCR